MLVAQLTWGQWYGFELSTTTDTYAELVSDSAITDTSVWTVVSKDIPIGFGFSISPLPAYDTLTVIEDGTISFFEDLSTNISLHVFMTNLTNRAIASGGSASQISYLIDGLPGSQIFKIQWKNMGFQREYDSLGTTNSYANVQLWLYEDQDCFEVRVGPNLISDIQIIYPGVGSGPTIGYYMATVDQVGSPIYLAVLLEGNPISPTLGSGGWPLDNTPSNGMVYTFCPATTQISDNIVYENTVHVSPNPFHLQTTLTFENSPNTVYTLTIFNNLGQIVRTVDQIVSTPLIIPRRQLGSGIYLYQLLTEGEPVAIGKLIIK